MKFVYKFAVVASLLLSATPTFAEEVCSLQQLSKGFTGVAKRATPAVVFIKVEVSADEGGTDRFGNPNDDFFNRFFGSPHGQQPQRSQGSGFFVSADGYIMTNAHVVKGADKIEVTMTDGRLLPASLVGSDPHTDIAVIKVEGKDFPYLAFGDSDATEVGEWAIAIGSPFQLEASLTVGVVSAKGRQGLRISDYEDFIQTDAAINPGNSGGPLLNIYGDVIGVNSAIVSPSGGSTGIGFAIPSNMAKSIMGQLIEKGSVTRGFLGVSLQPVDKEIAAGFNLDKAEGVLIAEVTKDSPADKAGLKQGDIILECNGKPIESLQSFRNKIGLTASGSVVSLKVNRKGQIVTIPVTLGSSAESMAVSSNLGFSVSTLTPEDRKNLGLSVADEGVKVTTVDPKGPAFAAGLRPGYLILQVDQRRVTTVDEFNQALNEGPKNRHVFLVKFRGVTRFCVVVLK